MPHVELTKIPKRIQKIYNIGPKAKGEVDGSAGGGHFTLKLGFPI
jgi:hypothetical protein